MQKQFASKFAGRLESHWANGLSRAGRHRVAGAFDSRRWTGACNDLKGMCPLLSVLLIAMVLMVFPPQSPNVVRGCAALHLQYIFLPSQIGCQTAKAAQVSVDAWD